MDYPLGQGLGKNKIGKHMWVDLLRLNPKYESIHIHVNVHQGASTAAEALNLLGGLSYLSLDVNQPCPPATLCFFNDLANSMSKYPQHRLPLPSPLVGA